MNEEIKIYQFEDSEGNKVAPLVPEKAVVDKDGVRLDQKLEALNVNTIKEQINTAKEKAIEEVEASSENLTKNVGLDEYETFSEAKEYPAGYTLLKDGLLYTFITDHAEGAWDESQVEKTNIIKLIGNNTDTSDEQIVSTIFTEKYGIIADIKNGNYGNGGNSSVMTYSDYVECNGFDKLNITIPTASYDSIYGLVFYDSAKKAIKKDGYNYLIRNTGEDSVENVEINIPEDAYYFRTTYYKDTETYGAFKGTLRNLSSKELQNQIDEINDKVSEIYNATYVAQSSEISWENGYYLAADSSASNVTFGEVYSNSSTSVSDYLDIKGAVKIKISVFQSDTNTTWGCVLYNSEKKAIKGYTFGNKDTRETAIQILTDIPSDAVYIRTCVLKADTANFAFEIMYEEETGLIPDIEKRISRLTQTVNILDYGVKSGDDISSTLQSIISQIKANRTITQTNDNVTIYVPKGTYYLSKALYWIDNLNLVGEGVSQTIFMPTGSQAAIINSDSNGMKNLEFRDFTIDGEKQQKKVPDAKGIYITKLTNATFRNINILNTSATGLGTDFFINGIIENVRCDNCGRDADLNTTGNGAAGCSGIGIGTGGFNRGNESLTIANCHCNNCGQYGIFVEKQGSGDYPVGVSIIGCTAEGNRTGFGVSGCDSAIFVGCTAYNNHHAGFAYDNGTMSSSLGKRPKYIGCVAYNNGKNIPVEYPEYKGQENGFGWYILDNYQGVELISCNAIGNLKSGIEVVNGITGLNISGGEFSENGEHGIDLNGNVTNFRISPTLIKSNSADGIRINGTLSKGFIKNISITANDKGIEKTATGDVGDCIIDENFVYNNTTEDSNL